METIYSIVYNSNNSIVYCTNDYNKIVTYIKEHFPKQSYKEYNCFIDLCSKNFTLCVNEINKSYV